MTVNRRLYVGIECVLAASAAALLVAAIAASPTSAYLVGALGFGLALGLALMLVASAARANVRRLRRRSWVYISYDHANKQRANRLREALVDGFGARVVLEELRSAPRGRLVFTAGAQEAGGDDERDPVAVQDTPGAVRDVLAQADAYLVMVGADSVALEHAVRFAEESGAHVVRVAGKSSETGRELGVDTLVWPKAHNSNASVVEVARSAMEIVARKSSRPDSHLLSDVEVR